MEFLRMLSSETERQHNQDPHPHHIVRAAQEERASLLLDPDMTAPPGTPKTQHNKLHPRMFWKRWWPLLSFFRNNRLPALLLPMVVDFCSDIFMITSDGWNLSLCRAGCTIFGANAASASLAQKCHRFGKMCTGYSNCSPAALCLTYEIYTLSTMSCKA